MIEKHKGHVMSSQCSQGGHFFHSERKEYEVEAITQSLQGTGIVYSANAVQNGIQTISSVLQGQDPSNGFVEKSKQICF